MGLTAGIALFDNSICQVSISSGSLTFSKIVDNSNVTLIDLIPCYCEFIIHTLLFVQLHSLRLFVHILIYS